MTELELKSKNAFSKPLNHELPLQSASLDIWDKKYRLKDKHGSNQETCVNETFIRIAKALQR